MLYRDIARLLSFFLLGFSITMLLPLGFAIYCESIAGPVFYPQPPCAESLYLTIAITLSVALLFHLLGRNGQGKLFRREALFSVVITYILMGILGALPFYLSNTLENPFDAFFESTSALTTTGASVMEGKVYDLKTNKEIPHQEKFTISQEKTYTYPGTIAPVKTLNENYTGVEAVSPALLLWRSEIAWIGGGGIIILFVAILPLLGVGGKILYQVESTGPSKDSLAPRIKETAAQLWKIYVGLTILQIILLLVTNSNMPLFDAVTISFSTISTAGFAIKNAGIAAYNSAATEWVVIVFMIFGSISFSIYFFAMQGRFRKINDPELRTFLFMLLIFSLFSTFVLLNKDIHPLAEKVDSSSFSDTFRQATFQIVSAQSSTGFATANYDLWPFTIQTLMVIIMFIGGMAGSTSGGIKVVRTQMIFRLVINKIETIFRPDTVRTCRLGTRIIDDQLAIRVFSYAMVVVGLTLVGTFLLVWDSVDPETAFTTMACMLNNAGMGFRIAGPLNSFAFLSDPSKLLSSLWMIAGRLEYFTLLVLFLPSFWKKN